MSDWYKKSSPEQITPTPWLHPDAIKYLENLLTPDMNVIEHGAGGSTLWFAERVRTVTSYENNEQWAGAIIEREMRNVFISTLLPLPVHYYDMVFIDGEPVQERCTWIRLAKDLVKPNGYIVLDNANRPEYQAERDYLQTVADLIHVVDGNEAGTRYLITEFYKVR